MINFFKEFVKATVRDLIVAFIYVFIVMTVFFFFFNDVISEVFSIVDLISEKSVPKVNEEIKINIETNVMEGYPELGTRYGTFKINSQGINLPIYYGDTMEILKYGMGHSPETYFPGEGGTIIYMAHNTANMLRHLPDVNIGDIIEINLSYGNYKYEVFDKKIFTVNNYDDLSINHDEEILKVYTCYPVTAITYTEYRYLVLARRIYD